MEETVRYGRIKDETYSFEFGKLPPQAKELEEVVIGAVLIEPQELHKALNILHSECFYVDAHQRIWKAISALYARNQPADILTVSEELRKMGELDNAGGSFYIATLTNRIGSAANVEYHAYIVKEKYVARKAIEIQSRCIRELYEDTEDAMQSLSTLQTGLLELNGEINKSKEVMFSDAVAERVTEIKEAAKDKTYKTGHIVHLTALDKQTMGWQPSDLIVVAARPAMGKTAFAVWCATQQAKNDLPVGFMSLEMSTNQLIDRILSSESQIGLETIRRAGMKFDEWQRFDHKVGQIIGYPFFVDDRGGLKITEVCNTITNWVVKYGIKVVYIDYLQLIRASGSKKNTSREQDVTEVTQALKALAKNMGIAIVALSQLSREVEKRSDKRPILADLRESGSIEQEADMVIFPFCENYYNEQADATKCELIIAKYRNGRTGMVEVDFIKEFQRFQDRTPF